MGDISAYVTGVGADLDVEAGATRGVDHGAHGGQVAAREDVLADEVAGSAVSLVPLVRLRYRLPRVEPIQITVLTR